MILEPTKQKDSVIEDDGMIKENQSQIVNSENGLSNENQPMLSRTTTKANYECLNKFLYSIPWQIFITVLTVFSLFSDDIRIVAFNSSGDIAFDILSILMILVFLLQIVLSWIAIEDYKFSFIFFLDLISSLSIVLDIVMLSDVIEQNSTFNLARITSQSKLTRVATRIVRIVKLFRIIRVMKLYKSALRARQIKEQIKRRKLAKQQNIKHKIIENSGDIMEMTNTGMILGGQNNLQIKKQSTLAINQQRLSPNTSRPKKTKKLSTVVEKQLLEEEKDIQNIDLSIDLHEIQQKQSKISKILSDMTIKKVIIVVLLLMFVIPLFDNDNYIDTPNTWEYINAQLNNLLLDKTFSTNEIKGWTQTAIDRHISTTDNLVYFVNPFNQLPQFISDEFYQQRYQDKSITSLTIDTSAIMILRPDLTLKTDSTGQIFSIVNTQQYNRKQAYLSIGRTMFICLVMIILLHLFSKNINELIVQPIEKMTHQVEMMAKNPEAVSTQPFHDVEYQTATVHNAIVKIGALLSLVFGSAGAQIIGHNIMQEGEMNVMIKGKKKCAIFGFCDIRNFTEITQILQQQIMIFVNTISQLVHSSVFRYGGAPNKNIGEAFLLVWNIPDQYYEINEATNQIKWKNIRYINILADFSLLSFVKNIVKINKDPEVLQYRKGRLANHFGQDFKVQMGFGLHIGWAIEGAIGSQYKIDASYLSPNVNMASRLEAATKQFGVTLLISQDLYDMLTPQMKEYCRNIDRVTVKGSIKPIRLYTVDLNISNISPPRNKQQKYSRQQDIPDVQGKRIQNMSYLTQNEKDYDAHQFIQSKKQLREVMVNVLPKQFKQKFETGLAQYYSGNWSEAKSNLKRALKIQKNDGPTRCILRYMKNRQYTAPADWKNYRQLTSK